MKQSVARIAVSEAVSPDTHVLVVEAPEIATQCAPGQFVMVRCGDLTLRRPLSVHGADNGHVALLYRAVGSGTKWLAGLLRGDSVDVYGPCGSGYTLPEEGQRVLLMAGGLGIAPLYFLASRLASYCEVVLVHGGRSLAEMYAPPSALLDYVPNVGAVATATLVQVTDDGTCGLRGTACDGIRDYVDWAQRIYVCGPVPMCCGFMDMSSGRDRDVESKILDAEVSLEVRMACGVGACYGCSIETTQGRRKVCQDGPVFRMGDVLWDEVKA